MKAAVIAVGTELVAGETVDTNSAWLSRQLADIGIETVRHTSVGDDEASLRDALACCARTADLIIITGGIGPTPDDITRGAVAEAAGVPLVRDKAVLAHIEGLFRGWGREMSPNNAGQADFPEGSRIIPNPRGTAAAFSVEISRSEVIVLPGVPNEMKLIWDASVRPHLSALSEGVTVTGTVDCFGRGESDITAAIGDFLIPGRNPSVGDTAEDAIIRVRIRARADTRDEARRMVEADKAEIRKLLGGIVFGEDGETLEGAVVKGLLSKGLTLAVAESCTGGLLAKRITDVPGASDCFLEGIVAYHNAAKIDLLNVPAELIEKHGAVSEEVAAAMAEGVRRCAKSDFALSTTGVAGPSGGTPEKPVGLVYIAVTSEADPVIRRLQLRGNRAEVRDRSVKNALNLLRLTASL
ncbi:MAG: competence/damage-inducible protein A [Planctomycetota bacterium]|jgi:nicotinamide-nucleotide amidase